MNAAARAPHRLQELEMGFLRRLADAFDPPAARAERRSRDLSWEAVAGAAPADWLQAKARGARFVAPHLAENLAAYLAAINVTASAIATFPALVYRARPDGREEVTDHAVADLIREGPNPWQTWPDLIEMLVAETLAFGNGLAEVRADRGGRVVELRPHPWRSVAALILPSGRLVYDVPESPAPAHAARLKRLLDGEVIHLRDRSDNGLIGRPRLARCAAPARVALTMQAYTEELYDNSARPSGVLTLNAPLEPGEHDALLAQMNQRWAGPSNAGRIMLLTGGEFKYDTMATSPEDLEMLSARRFSVEEMARIFQVPPPLIQDYSHNTFTNSHAAALWFAQHTLGPWVRKLEAVLKRALFSHEERREFSIEFDMSSLLRGDPAQRWQSHAIAVAKGILTPDEIREVEGWNPRARAEAPPRPGIA